MVPIIAAATLRCAAVPSLELMSTATNLVVTGEMHVEIRLVLPPLPDPFGDQPPIVNQRPPHVQADFLEQKDKPSGPLVPVDPKKILENQSLRDRNSPAFTLNNYMSTGLLSAMSDPFGMFDDDFFGRHLGPQKQMFPFTVGRIDRDGTNCWLLTISSAPWRAASPGKVVLKPVTMSIPLITGVSPSRDRFGRVVNRVNLREVNLRTKPLSITVSAPPESTMPDSFCGAIGSDVSVKASLDTNICTAGDPLVLTLDISGAADASMVHPPSIAKHVGDGMFRVDEASAKTETLAGSRRFTWRVRALKAGTVEFPSLPVSYFDPATLSYVTKHTESIPVQVRAGAQAALGAFTEEDAADEYPFPDGLDTDPAGADANPLLPHLALAIWLFAIPPALFLMMRLGPPLCRRASARLAAHRKATEFSRCRRILAGCDESRKPEAVRRFLSVRYGVNGAAATPDDVVRLMSGDFPSEDIERARRALADADRTNFSAKMTVASLLLALMATAAFGASTEFTWRRATALATRAATPAEFAAAADAFAECAAAGAANPTLFTNLGACRLFAGDPRAAREAFARAERYGGETPSTRRGLHAATTRIKSDPRAELPMYRVFFRPHVAYSTDTRLVAAAIAWALMWLVALLPNRAIRRFMLTVCMVAFVACTLSVTISLAEERLSQGAPTHVRK